jgi:CBS domain-containing protein
MIKVKKIMTRNVITVSKEADLFEAEKLVVAKNLGGIVVVEKNLPIGVVDQREIISGILAKKKKVREVMGMDFVVISPLTKFPELSSYIKKKNIKRFAVVDDGQLVGIITESDIIQSMRDFTRFDQTVQEVILVIFGLATAFFLLYFGPIGTTIFG